MKFLNLKWELIVSIASLIISIIALIYTFQSGSSCNQQTDDLLNLLHKVQSDIQQKKLNYILFEDIQNKLRFKIEKFSSSGCSWDDTLNTQRKLITESLWKSIDSLARMEPFQESDRKIIIGMLDTINLFCDISQVSCNERDKNDIDSLRTIYLQTP